MRSLKHFALVLLFALVANCFAEGRFCIGGNLEALSPQQLRVCNERMQQVRDAVSGQNAPDWHYVIVCDEEGWSDYAAFSSTSSEQLRTSDADTDLIAKTTFVRGSHLSDGVVMQIMTREVALIQANSLVQLASTH